MANVHKDRDWLESVEEDANDYNPSQAQAQQAPQTLSPTHNQVEEQFQSTRVSNVYTSWTETEDDCVLRSYPEEKTEEEKAESQELENDILGRGQSVSIPTKIFGSEVMAAYVAINRDRDLHQHQRTKNWKRPL